MKLRKGLIITAAVLTVLGTSQSFASDSTCKKSFETGMKTLRTASVIVKDAVSQSKKQDYKLSTRGFEQALSSIDKALHSFNAIAAHDSCDSYEQKVFSKIDLIETITEKVKCRLQVDLANSTFKSYSKSKKGILLKMYVGQIDNILSSPFCDLRTKDKAQESRNRVAAVTSDR